MLTLKQPGPIAIRAVKEALKNVGVTEKGANRGLHVETYQRAAVPPAPPGSPWCACFVSYRLQQAARLEGRELPKGVPLSAWCPDYLAWARLNSLWLPVSSRTGVRPGDLALFWFAVKGRVAHIGHVAEVHPWGCWTVEANTSDESEGVNRDGDGVFRKRREWREFGEGGGFVRLPF